METWSELYRTEYLKAKALKDLAQSSNAQMQSFHGNKLFWSKKKLPRIQTGAKLLTQRHHVVIIFFPLKKQRLSSLTPLTHSQSENMKPIQNQWNKWSKYSHLFFTKFLFYCWKCLAINSKGSSPCWSTFLKIVVITILPSQSSSLQWNLKYPGNSILN